MKYIAFPSIILFVFLMSCGKQSQSTDQSPQGDTSVSNASEESSTVELMLLDPNLDPYSEEHQNLISDAANAIISPEGFRAFKFGKIFPFGSKNKNKHLNRTDSDTSSSTQSSQEAYPVSTTPTIIPRVKDTTPSPRVATTPGTATDVLPVAKKASKQQQKFSQLFDEEYIIESRLFHNNFGSKVVQKRIKAYKPSKELMQEKNILSLFETGVPKYVLVRTKMNEELLELGIKRNHITLGDASNPIKFNENTTIGVQMKKQYESSNVGSWLIKKLDTGDNRFYVDTVRRYDDGAELLEITRNF